MSAGEKGASPQAPGEKPGCSKREGAGERGPSSKRGSAVGISTEKVCGAMRTKKTADEAATGAMRAPGCVVESLAVGGSLAEGDAPAGAEGAIAAVCAAVPAPGCAAPDSFASETLEEFRARVFIAGRELYRNLPWRNTRDPYAIWVSEAMLQQTQVSRVDGRWQRWLERFPSVDALAAASSADVLAEWQGLGYNRRALALWNAAKVVCETHAGVMPTAEAELKALPGIGPATAAGIRAFAYDLPGVYLETNVRTVFLHELFPDAENVPDSALVPLVRDACPGSAAAAGLDVPDAVGLDVTAAASLGAADAPAADTPHATLAIPAVRPGAPAGAFGLDLATAFGSGTAVAPGATAPAAAIDIPGADVPCTPRSWYYALLDYGAHLKRTVPNPSRRSRSNVRQSKFEGSHRQKRAAVVRLLLAAGKVGLTSEEAAAALTSDELAAGREPVSAETAASILSELTREGFCTELVSGCFRA